MTGAVTLLFRVRETATGGLVAGFVSDRFKVTSWLTLIAGMRPTHFSSSGSNAQAGVVGEHNQSTIWSRTPSSSFELGFSCILRPLLPGPPVDYYFRALTGIHSKWIAVVVCLSEAASATRNISLASPFPIRGWTLDADNFQTRANNCLRSQQCRRIEHLHSSYHRWCSYPRLGAHASLSAPLESWTVPPRLFESGRTGAWGDHRRLDLLPSGKPHVSTTAWLWSPRSRPAKHAKCRFQRESPVARFRLIQCVLRLGLSRTGCRTRSFPAPYLPGHTTFDVSLGKSFGEKYTVSLTALNVANRRVLLDNSLTFGGFHFNDPREIYVEFRYRFHY